ncbi:MAG: hypothetical protein PHF31_11975 [Methylobacter sp.]|nr:hypothetical protein [Methylobacter sp.]
MFDKENHIEACQNICVNTPAYWLTDINNVAFAVIAVMVVLFIPVFMAIPYFPDQPTEN